MARGKRGVFAVIDLTPSPEQQEILDLGLTTIRIRAGAGTGKTTTVAMVIANLIENHGVEPEQILGITFTNKAAAELSAKVRQMLPTEIDPGRQVEVHTYHGFAAQILSEFGALAGVDNRAKVITPTFARQIMRETFHHTAFDYLDITQVRSLDRVRKLGDRAGDHLLVPEDLISASPDPSDEVWAARTEMAETLREYAADKRRLRVVDYGDLVTLSTQIVRSHPELADAIRDRYRAVVLDEYQDTNPAQRVLLTSVFDEGFPVIAVGDEDQTIYEWRGASAENFELFASHFGDDVSERELTLNRRSAQPILDIANVVRSTANPTAEDLVAARSGLPADIATHWATDAVAEADWIASRFEEFHDSGSKWSEMAVLFRKNKDFAVVVEAMARRDIPVEVANVGGLFSVPEVADLRAWLTIIERPEDSAALTQVLFGSRYRLGLADLAPLTRWVASSLSEERTEDPAPVSLMEAAEAVGEISGLRQEAVGALERFLLVYRAAVTESQGQSLVEICRTVLDRTRAWQDIDALPPNVRLTARLNIYRLLDLADDWSPLKGRPSLGAFLDYLEAMEDEPTEELDSAHLSGEDAVTLVTVHRAKGLEWETVAIPAVTHGNFPSGSGQFPDPIRFAEHLPVDLRIDSVLDDLPADRDDRDDHLRARHTAQEWRVAYVAVTRAKQRLFVTGAYWYGLPEPSKRPKKPSELFEMVRDHEATRDGGTAELTPRPDLLRSPDLPASPDPLFATGWEDGLRSALAQQGSMRTIAEKLDVTEEYQRTVDETIQRLFNLAEPSTDDAESKALAVSVTGLVTYAQCPKRFFWTSVDPLPRRPNPAANHGTEVHRRIELHQRGQIPLDEFSPDLYDTDDSDSVVGPGAYTTYLESRFADGRAALVEVPFSIEVGAGHKVRGRIDAVYVEDGLWEVVDFKSGRPKDDPSRVVQLQAYAVAATDVDFGYSTPESMRVTFAYLGNGLDEVSYDADETWVEGARGSLESLTDRIVAEDFAEHPGQWCHSCDFLRFCGPGQAEVGS
ncbi:MAG: ATP-dependent DNA helicase [Actinomycetota bacterium]|nr:ATP-dependent DNA helicase [Actinomycetota bacterium]